MWSSSNCFWFRVQISFDPRQLPRPPHCSSSPAAWTPSSTSTFTDSTAAARSAPRSLLRVPDPAARPSTAGVACSSLTGSRLGRPHHLRTVLRRFVATLLRELVVLGFHDMLRLDVGAGDLIPRLDGVLPHRDRGTGRRGRTGTAVLRRRPGSGGPRGFDVDHMTTRSTTADTTWHRFVYDPAGVPTIASRPRRATQATVPGLCRAVCSPARPRAPDRIARRIVVDSHNCVPAPHRRPRACISTFATASPAASP